MTFLEQIVDDSLCQQSLHTFGFFNINILLLNSTKLECGPMPNVMAALSPAEYRWRPLFNAAKFGWRPMLECRAVTPKCETRWNLQGCHKLPDRSQPLVGWSSPYCGNMWRRYCCLTSFFPIVDTCLSCKDIAWQSCAMVPRWRFFDDFALCICCEPSATRFRCAS